MTGDDRRERPEVGAAIRDATATVVAPVTLRAAVTSRRERAGALGSRGRIAVPAAALAVVAVVCAIALTAGGGGTSSPAQAPSVAETAAAALRSPNRPAPPPDARDSRFVRAGVGSVRFPNYAYGGGWVAVGSRTDVVRGRRAVTVHYADDGRRVGYTILAGDPVAAPPRARRVRFGGVRAAVMRDHGVVVVTWRRDGHTCVLASRNTTARQMLRMAAWT